MLIWLVDNIDAVERLKRFRQILPNSFAAILGGRNVRLVQTFVSWRAPMR